MLLLCLVSVAVACVKHQWKTQTVFCCQNGTKIEFEKSVVWTKFRPFFCDNQEKEAKDEDALTAKEWGGIIFMVIGACCACHVSCGYCLYKMFWKKEEAEN